MKITKTKITADFNVSLTPEDMLNSDGFDLRNRIANTKQQRDAEIAQQKKEALIAEYSGLKDQVMSKPGANSDKLDFLFERLVPASGKADTVAGELVRAMTRIIYRGWNDGDLFYTGYGLETCADSVAYIVDTIPQFEYSFRDIAERRLSDDDYMEALESITGQLIEILFQNPEYFGEPNTTDSRDGHWDVSEIIDWAGTDDYSTSYPYDIEMFIQLDIISNSDVAEKLQEWLDYDWGSIYDTDASVWAGDYDCEINNITPDTYRTVEEQCYRWLEDWAAELVDEYGNPDDIQAERDAEYEDDNVEEGE